MGMTVICWNSWTGSLDVYNNISGMKFTDDGYVWLGQDIRVDRATIKEVRI